MSKDAVAIEQLSAAGADLRVPHTVLHYIYVPVRESAALIARELRQRGFQTEERLGADNVNWLVLATHQIVVSEATMAATRREMEALVEQSGGGEYDGWEASVRPANLN
jgi:Regulator of ribonuclease activity B